MTSYKFTVVIEKDEDGWFARVPELDGCYTQGDSYEEVVENLKDAAGLHLEDAISEGEHFPSLESVSLVTIEAIV